MVLCYLDGLQLDFRKTLHDLEPQQQAIFWHFRNEIFPTAWRETGATEEAQIDDFTRLRFLRADKFNAKIAAARLVSTLQWRVSVGIDKIENQPPRAWNRFRRFRVRRFVGCDYKGNVVMLERLGEFFGSYYSARKMEPDEWLSCYAYEFIVFERLLRESSQRTGIPITSLTYIGDLTGLRFAPAMTNLPHLRKVTEVVEVHFPETVSHIMLINAVPLINIMVNAAGHFLDPVVLSKLTVHTGVPTRRLLELMPADILPIEYGGTSTLKLPHVVGKDEISSIDDNVSIDEPIADAVQHRHPVTTPSLFNFTMDSIFGCCLPFHRKQISSLSDNASTTCRRNQNGSAHDLQKLDHRATRDVLLVETDCKSLHFLAEGHGEVKFRKHWLVIAIFIPPLLILIKLIGFSGFIP